MRTETIDTERQVKVIKDDFALLRYASTTPIALRRHDITTGRHADYDAAAEKLDHLLAFGNPDIRTSASFLTIEERSEEWEEGIPCKACGPGYNLGDDGCHHTVAENDAL